MKKTYGQCPSCNKYYGGLHIHHKDRNHKNNDPDNLLLLCPLCHSKEHEFEKGLMKEKTFDLCDLLNKQHEGYRLMRGFGLLNPDND